MDFNSSVVHLSHGLHLQVIPVAVVTALPVDVLLEILRYKLGEVVSILQLEREGEGEKNREGMVNQRGRWGASLSDTGTEIPEFSAPGKIPLPRSIE